MVCFWGLKQNGERNLVFIWSQESEYEVFWLYLVFNFPEVVISCQSRWDGGAKKWTCKEKVEVRDRSSGALVHTTVWPTRCHGRYLPFPTGTMIIPIKSNPLLRPYYLLTSDYIPILTKSEPIAPTCMQCSPLTNYSESKSPCGCYRCWYRLQRRRFLCFFFLNDRQYVDVIGHNGHIFGRTRDDVSYHQKVSAVGRTSN